MKKTKNVVISLLVLLVAAAGIIMTIVGMFGKMHDAPEAVAIGMGKHFDLWKDMESSDLKSFMGVVFFGGIISLVLSVFVAFAGIKWTIKSIKGDFNVGIIKFVGLLILCAAVFAISIAVVACADTILKHSTGDIQFDAAGKLI